ncbi:MAG: hypothetical protein A3F15_01945 [Candidatus Wildermuthbacteria bacterium RIFCSPHIGHO2_12_FULL_40_12]|uniref:Uncharacterized protein n=1 Tax=Candidatus Wildermuthbacteria bacterium RIFCSPHIGHO2_12_FULL_40_12 TaxID=1802457 RepID=A0A1G2RD30_9BACT|nr:MAG: hypothetical protein A3F15_01945 [Candidatus Wildermuthbacteria bacterium RIFCSPHIGHO2_12_FULL_40_12]HXK40687.1 hypothetical protein [Candidatus Paceibacterota bacterium]
MLSIQRTKELLNEPEISDTEAEQIRSKFYMLADLLLDSWQANGKKPRSAENKYKNYEQSKQT